MRSLQDLQTGCPEGLSGFAQAVKGSHQGIIRQKHHGHSKTPHNGLLLCRGCQRTCFRVRPAMFLEPERFGYPFPFGGAGPALSHMAFNRMYFKPSVSSGLTSTVLKASRQAVFSSAKPN